MTRDVVTRRKGAGQSGTGQASCFLQLVDWSSRLIQPGNRRVAGDAPALLARLQIDAGSWQATLEKLVRSTKTVGSDFGGTNRLNELAAQRGHQFLKNITGRETDLTAPRAG